MKGGEKIKVSILFILGFLTILVWLIPIKNSSNILSVYFLDVGQGDSIFIEAPNGNQMLIDGGRNSSALSSLMNYVKFGDNDIDVVIATHPDSDHIGGLPGVFERFNIINFVDSSVSSDTNIYNELALQVKNEGSRYIKGERGMVIVLDKNHGVYFQVLSPDKSFNFDDTNNMSIVGRLVYGDSSFLLTGDASKAVENILAYTDESLLESDVLKAGHHGSKTSSSLLFLEKVKPKYSVISAGANNTYGHPHQVVLDNLSSVGSNILETKDKGTIIFKTDGKNLWFE